MNIDIHSEPGVFRIEATHQQVSNAVLRLKLSEIPSSTFVLRGNKMRTEAQALDELSAALQFPYYIGSNWNAVDECINDPDWMPRAPCVILVSNFSECFEEEPDRLQLKDIFVRLLTTSVDAWQRGLNGRILRVHVYLCGPPLPN